MNKYICLSNSPYSNRILTDEQLSMLLWSDEYDGLAPGQSSDCTQEEIDSIIANLSGKSIKDYCHWRWPDNPEEQFLYVLECLSDFEQNKGDVYVVYNLKKETIMKNMTYKQALGISNQSFDTYVLPMEAINPI
jgi:hypothetical protein